MKRMMTWLLMGGVLLAALATGEARAQVGIFTKEQLIKYTPMWKGERFQDGRPKVSDDILNRMKKVSIISMDISKQAQNWRVIF
jgi:hypothetical protein